MGKESLRAWWSQADRQAWLTWGLFGALLLAILVPAFVGLVRGMTEGRRALDAFTAEVQSLDFESASRWNDIDSPELQFARLAGEYEPDRIALWWRLGEDADAFKEALREVDDARYEFERGPVVDGVSANGLLERAEREIERTDAMLADESRRLADLETLQLEIETWLDEHPDGNAMYQARDLSDGRTVVLFAPDTAVQPGQRGSFRVRSRGTRDLAVTRPSMFGRVPGVMTISEYEIADAAYRSLSDAKREAEEAANRIKSVIGGAQAQVRVDFERRVGEAAQELKRLTE